MNHLKLSTKQNGIDEKAKTEVCNFAEFATLQSESSLPLIPDGIFPLLPNLLIDGCSYFDNKFQRDLFLTGALGVISGCFNNVMGDYHIGENSPNLYAFISAPAASGKGALAYAKALALPYHKHVVSSNKEENKTKKILFIPGNTSASALISHLEKNDGEGIFFETEADTLSNTFKQEWGNFSDLLRKAFHHEAVSLTRKGNNEYVEINNPKLSVVLSGTPNQISRLIPSAEDGLFSRFIFYHFESDPKWDDVTPNRNKERAYKYFEKLSTNLLSIILEIQKYKEVRFRMTNEQFKHLNEIQNDTLTAAVERFGNDATGIIKRQGVIWFKLSMILSILRNHEMLNSENLTIDCDELDFIVAKELVKVYTQHSFFVYKSLKTRESTRIYETPSLALYDLLPGSIFPRNLAIELCEKVGVKTRKIDEYLKELVRNGLLKKSGYGNYIKINDSSANLQSAN